jgi:predicted nucleic acid-binding protein
MTRRLLAHFPNLYIQEVTRTIARRAAQLRAVFSLRPADAIHVATGLVGGATAWITNDRELRRLTLLIDVVVLGDLLEGNA